MATPLIPFTLAWLIGIWLAPRIAVPSIMLGVAAGAAFVGVILRRRERGLRWMFVLVFAATLGALRYDLAQPHFDQTSLATYNDQQKSVSIEGIVIAEPDTRDTYTNLRVEAHHLLILRLGSGQVSNLPDGITRTVKGLVQRVSITTLSAGLRSIRRRSDRTGSWLATATAG